MNRLAKDEVLSLLKAVDLPAVWLSKLATGEIQIPTEPDEQQRAEALAVLMGSVGLTSEDLRSSLGCREFTKARVCRKRREMCEEMHARKVEGKSAFTRELLGDLLVANLEITLSAGMSLSLFEVLCLDQEAFDKLEGEKLVRQALPHGTLADILLHVRKYYCLEQYFLDLDNGLIVSTNPPSSALL
ncbi:MAG: hypothetical protein PHY48_16875 [Candidatus Cloacimonetes bacterium]|nr:hypothetical protein [Candidatus Cloacimonadota bacterium]